MGQGFLFAKPLPGQELASLLDDRAVMASEAEALAHGRSL
jgi:hypothetical protein